MKKMYKAIMRFGRLITKATVFPVAGLMFLIAKELGYIPKDKNYFDD